MTPWGQGWLDDVSIYRTDTRYPGPTAVGRVRLVTDARGTSASRGGSARQYQLTGFIKPLPMR